MGFSEEIRNYTDEELELIISTQKDLYTEEEMAEAIKVTRSPIDIKTPETIPAEVINSYKASIGK